MRHEPYATNFEYENEEIAIQYNGETRFVTATYFGEIDWEYDSGDPDVGIWGGYNGMITAEEITNIRILDHECEVLLVPSQEEAEEIKKLLPKLTRNQKKHIVEMQS